MKGHFQLVYSHASHVFQLDWLERTTHPPTHPPAHQPTHPPTHQPTHQPTKLLASRSFYILGVAIIFEITKAWPLAETCNISALPTGWSLWWQSAKVKPFWKIQFVLVLWFVKMLQVYVPWISNECFVLNMSELTVNGSCFLAVYESMIIISHGDNISSFCRHCWHWTCKFLRPSQLSII